MNYLLDTNVAIFYLRGKFDLKTKVASVGLENCFISEITVAELRFDAGKSSRPEHHHRLVDDLVAQVDVIRIDVAIPHFAKEKARLQRLGTPPEDFDLLIGSTAVVHGYTIGVTNNTAHFSRISGIQLEDWTQQDS